MKALPPKGQNSSKEYELRNMIENRHAAGESVEYRGRERNKTERKGLPLMLEIIIRELLQSGRTE